MSLVVVAGVFINDCRGSKLPKLLLEVKVDRVNLRLNLLLSLLLHLHALLLDVIPQPNLALQVVEDHGYIGFRFGFDLSLVPGLLLYLPKCILYILLRR